MKRIFIVFQAMFFLKNYSSFTALCGYLFLTALFYAPQLSGLRTFPDGDFTHHFLLFSLFQQKALATGVLPLWNPYTYAGHPFLADVQAAVFYPLSNLLLLLTLPLADVGNSGGRLYFLQIEAMLHVALAGWFVYLLSRALVQNGWAAFLSGCCFAFSGYLTGYPPLQLAVLRTAIWLPLLLWLLGQALAEPQRWRWWIGAALAYATAFLAGHPQTFLHSSYAMAAWIIIRSISGKTDKTVAATSAMGPLPNPIPTPKATAARLTGLLIFPLLAIALSAAQLLPSLEFTQLSVRANVDYGYVSGGFPLQDSWQLLLPAVLTQFSPLYIGVIGLGCALLALAQWRDWGVRFFLGLTVVALLLAYGGNAFLYPLFYRFAPGWNFFRGQERAAFLVTLGLSLLAGYGAALMPALAMRQRRWMAMLYTVITVGGVYLFGLFWQLPGRTAISQERYLLIALLTLILAMTLVVAWRMEGWSRRRTLVVIGLALLNLFGANFAINIDQFSPTRKTILAPEMEALLGAVESQGDTNVGLPGRTYNEFRVYEDYGMRLQVEDVWGSSPLRLARYAALFENFPLDRMWRLTGVQHLLTWRRELFTPSERLAEFPQATDTTYLHRLPTPNPRAWMVFQLQPADDTQALALLADHNFDLEQRALLPSNLLAEPIALPATPAAIKLTRLADNRLQVETESILAGLLVVSENWMPGWQVEATFCQAEDGTWQPITNCPARASPVGLPFFVPLRTNVTFLGIILPPGKLRFELFYWPNSVRWGLWISGVTSGLLALWAIWRYRSRA